MFSKQISIEYMQTAESLEQAQAAPALSDSSSFVDHRGILCRSTSWSRDKSAAHLGLAVEGRCLTHARNPDNNGIGRQAQHTAISLLLITSLNHWGSLHDLT